MTLKHYLIAFILLTAAITTGMLLTKMPALTSAHIGASTGLPEPANKHLTETRPDAIKPTDQQAYLDRIATLEQGMADLQARLAMLEGTGAAAAVMSERLIAESADSDGNTLPDALPTLDALIQAGIDPFTAQEITDRQSSLQLARLELRDQALREGFLGSERYREELKNIRQAEGNIRNEVNESAYDKYLFHTGQNNRIKVESVIPGSNAENSGIETGDVILRYEDEPLYNFRDLRSATIEGEKDEIIRVTVDRNGDQFTLSMPRGPLGVRLNFLRVDPDSS